MNVAVIKALGWAGADKDNIEELVEQSEDVIANSFGVEADFSGEIPSTPRHTHALLKLLKQLCCPPPQPPPPQRGSTRASLLNPCPPSTNKASNSS